MEMQEKKEYVIKNKKFKLREFEVNDYRKVARFIAKQNLKQFYKEVDGKLKIEVGDMIVHLTMSNMLDKFLGMILEEVGKGFKFKFKIKFRKIFRINTFKHISDIVLVEVLADFFSGKVQLWTGLMKSFLPFLQNLNLPLNQLEQFQTLTQSTTE